MPKNYIDSSKSSTLLSVVGLSTDDCEDSITCSVSLAEPQDKCMTSSNHYESSSINSISCSTTENKKEHGNCLELIKKYKSSKDELLVYNDIIMMLEFIKNKLSATRPIIFARNTENYSNVDNIKWLEKFVDTLFCVIRKNQGYKKIHVVDVKEPKKTETSQQVYNLKVHYKIKGEEHHTDFQIIFRWNLLANTKPYSYAGVFKITNDNINILISDYKAKLLTPFFKK
jgi:hypothetical protein